MCCSKDQFNKRELETKVINYKKVLLKFNRNSKENHFNKFFRENKLNLFKTLESIREIIKISKQQISHLFKLVIKQLKIPMR